MPVAFSLSDAPGEGIAPGIVIAPVKFQFDGLITPIQ